MRKCPISAKRVADARSNTHPVIHSSIARIKLDTPKNIEEENIELGVEYFLNKLNFANSVCFGFGCAFKKNDPICKRCPRNHLPKNLPSHLKKEIRGYAMYLKENKELVPQNLLDRFSIEQIAQKMVSCKLATNLRVKERKQELDRKEKHLREAFGLDPNIDDIRISNTLKSIRAKFKKEDDIAREKREESLIQLKKKLNKGG